MTYVRKRYTKTFSPTCAENKDRISFTIAHIGNRNSNSDPGETVTLYDVNQDNQLKSDMGLYQFAKITGVAFKLYFPEGTTPEATPIQWSMGYSASDCLYPKIVPERLQTLATYQTSSCSATQPISRYYRTGAALARQGIEWFNTDEFP